MQQLRKIRKERIKQKEELYDTFGKAKFNFFKNIPISCKNSD